MCGLGFCLALWLNLPHNGVALLYDSLAPAMRLRAQRVGALLPSLPQPLVGALSLLLHTVVPARLRTALAQAATEGGVLLGAGLFLLTPTPITKVGLAYFSMGYPCLKSIDALKRSAEEVSELRTHRAPKTKELRRQKSAQHKRAPKTKELRIELLRLQRLRAPTPPSSNTSERRRAA